MLDNSGKGWTPLDCAAHAGALEVCNVLVDNQAALDPMDKSQTTPLHHACKGGHLEVVKYLLNRNAILNAVDLEGRNALDFAIDYYHEDVVEEILKSTQWKEALTPFFRLSEFLYTAIICQTSRGHLEAREIP